ncbi:MAG: hypothetical protein ACK4K6_16880, partial [Pseudarthrobacter sp.]
MTQTSGGPRPQAGPPSSPALEAEHRPHVPRLADGVQLIGESEGSGYREPPSLVRRADGQTLQLTPLLYLVLEAVDGTRGLPEIAEHAS